MNAVKGQEKAVITLEQVAKEVEKRIREKNFAALINCLTKEEQEILLVLIREGQALPIRTIRNLAVRDQIMERKQDIYERFGLSDTGDNPIEEFGSTKAIREFLAKRPEISLPYKFDKKNESNEFRIKLVQTFMQDWALLAVNIKPQSLSDKVKVWEIAMKGWKKLPSWSVVSSSLENLVGMNLVQKRQVTGRKSELVYYVGSIVYQIWEEKKKGLPGRKGYIPTGFEKKWFF